MAGDRFRLDVQQRDQVGTPESRRLRKQGFIPGVLYGKETAVAIAIKERDLRTALTGSSGLHAVLDVVVEGTTATHSAILKEYQRDPIRGHLRHVDLQEVRLDQPIHATVSVHLVGTEDAPGVKEGGVLSAPSNVLNVEALPMEVPESIEVDVSGMEMGDTLRLEDVRQREGVIFLDDPHDTVLATVSAPMRAEELEAAEDEAAAEGLGDGVEEVAEVAADGEAPEGEAEPEGDVTAEPGSDSAPE